MGTKWAAGYAPCPVPISVFKGPRAMTSEEGTPRDQILVAGSCRCSVRFLTRVIQLELQPTAQVTRDGCQYNPEAQSRREQSRRL